jgi:hypothetical protein
MARAENPSVGHEGFAIGINIGQYYCPIGEPRFTAWGDEADHANKLARSRNGAEYVGHREVPAGGLRRGRLRSDFAWDRTWGP